MLGKAFVFVERIINNCFNLKNIKLDHYNTSH